MKTIINYFVFLIALIFSTSCAKEEMKKVDPNFILSFQRDGKMEASAGEEFYIIPTGSGEFLTLYDGTKGHIWGDTVLFKGVDFNKRDSLPLSYNESGKYKVTLVASSSGDFGKDFSRNSKTVEITVVDHRNTFSTFSINNVIGEMTNDNQILFAVPDVVTDFNFIPSFGLKSDLAKVYVNGVEQISGVTPNDFKNPVVYTIKSAQGDEMSYTVKVTTFLSSSEKAITKFNLGTGAGGNGEIGEIDEANKIINFTVNYATTITAVKLIFGNSYGSTVYLKNAPYSDRKTYDLSSSGIKEIKVIAQDKSEVIYKVNSVISDPVLSFTFEGLVPAPEGVINTIAKTISVDVLKGTDVTKLVAKWAGSLGIVKIGTVAQKNGETVNDFTAPVTYTFYKGITAGDKYKVTVNVK